MENISITEEQINALPVWRKPKGVMCPNERDRECFYPDKCQEAGCYFVNREQQRLREPQELERQQEEIQEEQEQKAEEEREESRQKWAEFNDWFHKRKNQ